MMSTAIFFILALTPCLSQRPFYAGKQPIGYPAINSDPELASRFGNEDSLPAQLKGDQEYADRLNKLPVNQQPIWWINRKQYEDALKNPQTYPQRPSIFSENSNRI